METKKIICCLIIITTLSALYSNSLLSLRSPAGLPVNYGSGTSLSMGGCAAGVPNSYNLLLKNPAALGSVDITTFSSTVSINGIRIHDGSSHSNHISFSPDYLAFGFPLPKLGTIAFSMAKHYEAFFKGRYSVKENSFNKRISIHRNGGLSLWKAGWGYSFGPDILFGISYRRNYLSINTTAISDLINEDSRTAIDSTSYNFQGNGIDIGIMMPYKIFTAGIYFSYNFQSDLKTTYGSYAENQDSTLSGKLYDSKTKSSLSFPPELSFGASCRLLPELLIASDVSITFWKQFESSVLPANNLRNSLSTSLGIEFVPASDILAPRYWQKMHFRTGFRYTQLPEKDSREIALTVGTGLPVKSRDLLDLIIEGGRRSCDLWPDNHEDFVRFSIGINLGGNRE